MDDVASINGLYSSPDQSENCHVARLLSSVMLIICFFASTFFILLFYNYKWRLVLTFTHIKKDQSIRFRKCLVENNFFSCPKI